MNGLNPRSFYLTMKNLPLLKIHEREDLIRTEDYPFANFPFEKFNPVQSGLFSVYDKDANCIVAASTSAGKTVCGEMFMAHEVRANKNKVIYLSPLKSLSQEKLDDWNKEAYHFGDLKVAICTGDYRMTAERKRELEEADIIIMTSEMLNSSSRNHKADKNQFLKQVGLVVIDESHLLGVPGRGDHLESGIMKFTEANTYARFLLLSATMPNVDEVGRWLHSLNGKSTYLLQSDYRPCKLNIHYEKYLDVAFGYDENESRKAHMATQIIRKHIKDKFICFVHTKKTGELLLQRLIGLGIKCDYHNANLDKDKRVKIERQFREDPDLRVIVATSGLAQGLNMPARRVIILGLHRGLTEVETHDIIQMAGRAGRPQYDPEGDAYILVPIRNYDDHVKRLTKPVYITSQMINPKVLAFHLVSEIHHGVIKSLDDVYDWYSRTLAHFQKVNLDEEIIEKVMKSLLFSGCVKDEGGDYKVTSTGTVASMFYYSPFDVADLSKNFARLFDTDRADSDLWLSMALGNTDTNRIGIVNTAERNEMEEYFKAVSGKIEKTLSPKQPFTAGAMKAGYCYHKLLEGDSSSTCNNVMRNLQMDFGRVGEVLVALDNMSGKWGQESFFKRLGLRVSYGVSEELVDLCRLKGIGKAKAKKLWAAGLHTLKDLTDSVKIIKALNCSKKVAEEVIKNAKTIEQQEVSVS